MHNYINYYYSIDANNLRSMNNCYFFESDSTNYILYKIAKNDLKNNTFFSVTNPQFHTIIRNIYGNKFSLINGEEWALLKVNTTLNHKIDFNSVLFFLKNNISGYYKKIPHWSSLWMNKIDYYEQFINTNDTIDSKIKILCIYYLGLAENAAKYLAFITKMCDKDLLFSLSHHRIKSSFTVVDLYNPFNIIEDHVSRDISEYIKSFYKEIEKDKMFDMISNLNLNNCDTEFFLARMMFPSFFFDSFDYFYEEDYKAESLFKYYDFTDEYELFLKELIEEIKKNRNIIVPNIKWFY